MIGLLATPGTIKRNYTNQLITEFAGDCEITKIGSSELVLLAEQKLQGEPIEINAIKRIVEPFQSAPFLDTVVLACTHFPLLKEELKTSLPHIQHWVDSGDAIARRVGYYLSHCELIPLNPSTNKEATAYFTRTPKALEKLSISLHNMNINKNAILDPCK